MTKVQERAVSALAAFGYAREDALTALTAKKFDVGLATHEAVRLFGKPASASTAG